MTDEELKVFAEEALRRVNSIYRIEWVGRPDNYTWDGSVLQTSSYDVLEAIHDVAHVLVAPPSRRGLPEFGLGPDPANPTDAPVVNMKWATAQREEILVCRLHWMMAVYVRGVEAGIQIADYLNIWRLPGEKWLRRPRPFYRYLPEDFVDTILEMR